MSEYWQTALKTHWGLTANLTRLDGEYDLNFLASGSQDYVLKVMRAGCKPAFIDMQCRAFEHIRQHAAGGK